MPKLFAFLVVAAVVVKFFWLLVAIAALYAAARFTAAYWRRHDALVAARHERDAELVARADRQHAAILAGNERVGMYGEWEPVSERVWR